VAGGRGLVDGGHADEVGAEGAEGADLAGFDVGRGRQVRLFGEGTPWREVSWVASLRSAGRIRRWTCREAMAGDE